MKKVLLISFVILSVAAQMTHAQKQAVIKLTETTLMHEMRATPYPLDKAVVNDRAVSFQWPLRSDMNSQDSPLDGFEHKVKKVNHERTVHCKYFTKTNWGKADNYNLMIRSSDFGYKQTANLIINAFRLKFKSCEF